MEAGEAREKEGEKKRLKKLENNARRRGYIIQNNYEIEGEIYLNLNYIVRFNI